VLVTSCLVGSAVASRCKARYFARLAAIASISRVSLPQVSRGRADAAVVVPMASAPCQSTQRRSCDKLPKHVATELFTRFRAYYRIDKPSGRHPRQIDPQGVVRHVTGYSAPQVYERLTLICSPLTKECLNH
jgi:hypothetical protein